MDSTASTPALRPPADDELDGLLDELEKSGETLAGFARSRGLSSWKLYKARRRRDAETSKPVVFEPVRIIASSEDLPAIELEHSTGHRLRIPVGFDPATLQRVIEVLGTC